jgi:hypothetical protein
MAEVVAVDAGWRQWLGERPAPSLAFARGQADRSIRVRLLQMAADAGHRRRQFFLCQPVAPGREIFRGQVRNGFIRKRRGQVMTQAGHISDVAASGLEMDLIAIERLGDGHEYRKWRALALCPLFENSSAAGPGRLSGVRIGKNSGPIGRMDIIGLRQEARRIPALAVTDA